MGGACVSKTIDCLVFTPPKPCSYEKEMKEAKQKGDLPEGIHFVTTKHGSKIPLHIVRHRRARCTVLYSHGNSEDLGPMLSNQYLSDWFRGNYISYDYTGYGYAEGGEHTEENVYNDIEAIYDYLINEAGIKPSELILYGRSLGSGPTIHLAATNPNGIAGMVLESALLSIIRTQCRCVSKSWTCDMFNNIDKVAAIECPTLIIHGTRDCIVPHYHGRHLQEHIKNTVDPLWLPRGHNDIWDGDEAHCRPIFNVINKFITHCIRNQRRSRMRKTSHPGKSREVDTKTDNHKPRHQHATSTGERDQASSSTKKGQHVVNLEEIELQALYSSKMRPSNNNIPIIHQPGTSPEFKYTNANLTNSQQLAAPQVTRASDVVNLSTKIEARPSTVVNTQQSFPMLAMNVTDGADLNTQTGVTSKRFRSDSNMSNQGSNASPLHYPTMHVHAGTKHFPSAISSRHSQSLAPYTHFELPPARPNYSNETTRVERAETRDIQPNRQSWPPSQKHTVQEPSNPPSNQLGLGRVSISMEDRRVRPAGSLERDESQEEKLNSFRSKGSRSGNNGRSGHTVNPIMCDVCPPITAKESKTKPAATDEAKGENPSIISPPDSQTQASTSQTQIPTTRTPRSRSHSQSTSRQPQPQLQPEISQTRPQTEIQVAQPQPQSQSQSQPRVKSKSKEIIEDETERGVIVRASEPEPQPASQPDPKPTPELQVGKGCGNDTESKREFFNQKSGERSPSWDVKIGNVQFRSRGRLHLLPKDSQDTTPISDIESGGIHGQGTRRTQLESREITPKSGNEQYLKLKFGAKDEGGLSPDQSGSYVEQQGSEIPSVAFDVEISDQEKPLRTASETMREDSTNRRQLGTEGNSDRLMFAHVNRRGSLGAPRVSSTSSMPEVRELLSTEMDQQLGDGKQIR
ncbi:hypothetical protein AAMO2058_001295400 [Amorphochlora amoebiformis]